MNFKSSERVNSVIDATEQIDEVRQRNRVVVDDLFNSFPPMDDATAKKVGMRINVNWNEAAVIGKQAEGQYSKAFLGQNYFFKVAIPDAPPDKRQDWELFITRKINKPLKKSLPFFELMRSKFASVVRHGIGPVMWTDREDWLPEFVALDDLRVPTDTTVSMTNLIWFGVRKRYTPWELARKVFGKNSDAGWQKPVVSKILNEYKDLNSQDSVWDWATSPEKVMELWKQNAGFYQSDAVPSINVWHFYYLDEENTKSTDWKLKIVPTTGTRGVDRNTFLYDGDNTFADELGELVHIQYGDLNGKAPFMFHSVRGLGMLLAEPCYWMNLTRCRFIQHVWENFNLILRVQDPNDRSRTQKTELFDKGIIPDGVTIIPKEQRHQIDHELVEMAMAQMKQLMGEASAAYTQDVDNGTSKERTAFEVMTLMQQVNSMMGSLLSTAYQYEIHAYREIARRFCNKKTLNRDVREFRKACLEEGIPARFIDSELWEITPDFPLGSGNQTMELSQAKLLMEIKPQLDPVAQGKVMHMYVAAATQSPSIAEDLAPVEGNKGVSDAMRDAEFAFATLMLGVPVRMKEGLNPIDQISTLLGLMAGVIAMNEKAGTADAQTISGLQNVAQYVSGLIQQLSQDVQQKPLVKQFSDSLGKLMNQVKAFAQRLQEQQPPKESITINFKDLSKPVQDQVIKSAGFIPDPNPDALPVQTAAKLQSKTVADAQKMAHKDVAFHAEQQRKDLGTVAEINRTAAKENAKPEPEVNGEK